VPYAELHCLSNFSFQRGASHAGELVERAVELGYSALAITDECSVAGVVRAYEAARSSDLKLIIGAEFHLEDGPSFVLLAPDHAAYSQLCGLITRGRRAAGKGQYRLTRSDCDNLDRCLALWLPQPGAVAEDGIWLNRLVAQAWVAVELFRGPDDLERRQWLSELARHAGLLCVAAGDVRMHVSERQALLDVLTAVREGCSVSALGYKASANAEKYLRPIAELERLYPEAWVGEAKAIADRCHFSLKALKYDYPNELVPPGHSPGSWLRELTEQGLRQRYADGASAKVRKLIEKELALIIEMRYEAFFLTVQDVVCFARRQNILCQGRGSAANSAVCYALGITAVDPDRQNVLFERFISRERDEPPDIDVDFEHDRREIVIQYIFAKYGRQRAALAATVISYRSKSALRDVGRALGFEEDDIDRLSKSLAWWDRPEELDARLASLGFDPQARTLQLWLELARTLVGFPRHLSQHVGGFVISERPLHELVPIENAAMADRTVIQWDKDDLEALGLLKVDVLALGMLSALRRCLALVNHFRGSALDLATIPAEDPATYEMIQKAETIGVFQIESRAQQSMLPRLRPECFYDLVIEVAIVRPGPIQGGMVHPYLRRRAGEEPEDCPPQLAHILSRTRGVPIFQEQVMEIAITAASFTPGEADQMRRSMAAWKRSGGLEKYRDRLIGGMLANGYALEFAEQVYQRILGFGSYGFPESHSASFALLAYDSAWLKCHEPAAFVCALLNSQPMGFYPPSMLVREAQRNGVQIRPVDVLHSDWDNTLEPDPDSHGGLALRLGMRQIEGLQQAAADALTNARQQRPFASLNDLIERSGLDRRSLEQLADADALLALAGDRHRARWEVAAHLPHLPMQLPRAAEPELDLRLPSDGESVLADYQSIGLSLRAHPVSLVRERLRKRRVLTAVDAAKARDRARVRTAGLVMFRQRPGSAKGVLFMTLEDETGTINLILRPRFVELNRDVVIGTRFALATGEIQSTAGIIHLVVSKLEDLSAWLAELPSMSRDFR